MPMPIMRGGGSKAISQKPVHTSLATASNTVGFATTFNTNTNTAKDTVHNGIFLLYCWRVADSDAGKRDAATEQTDCKIEANAAKSALNPHSNQKVR